jgi:hypothetical protein
MKTPDYSNLLSARSGSTTRLMAVLREFMIYHEYNITPLPEGGFSARKPRLRRKKHDPLLGLSELRATPMGCEVMVDASFGEIRTMRMMLMIIFLLTGIGMFTAMSFDPKVANTPQHFFPLLVFVVLTLLTPLITAAFKRRTLATLERLLRAAVNITELP